MLNDSLFASMEQLEDRTLMAGSVTAAIVSGDLVITGDAANNVFQIAMNDAGTITISGSSNTSINGTNNGSVTFAASAVNNLTINGKEGTDTIRFEKFGSPNNSFEGDVTVRGDTGDDALIINNSYFLGNVLIEGENGDDLLGVFNAEIAGNLTINGDGGGGTTGNDQIQLGKDSLNFVNVPQDRTTVQGTTTIDGADGNNKIYVGNLYQGGAFSATTGTGTDVIDLRTSVFSSTTVSKTGDGADQLFLTSNIFLLQTKAYGQGGNDDVRLFNNVFSHLTGPNTISGGAGTGDVLTLSGNALATDPTTGLAARISRTGFETVM